MNFSENVREGVKAIRANALRSALTTVIIAIGITALVGILTAIDGLQASVADSFADLGANSFDIEAPRRRRGAFGPPRRVKKAYPAIKYRQVQAYKEEFPLDAQISVSVSITGSAEVKYASEKTNPNVRVSGINEHYLLAQSLELSEGRNVSNFELKQGSYVAIIGEEVRETLFDKQSPLEKLITFRGNKYKVIGVLEKKGSSQSGSGDRSVLLPLENARILLGDANPTFKITTLINTNLDIDMVMGEATSLMRRIRKDAIGQPSSFEIRRSETLADRLGSITGYLKIGGGVVGFITLLGASIGLMNIMLVSVTERTREIGIRKALGATPARIREQFLIEAIIICQLGGIFGIFLGILAGNSVSRLFGTDGFVIPWFSMLIAILVCIIVGISAGFYPAYKASKLDPIESLRFE